MEYLKRTADEYLSLLLASSGAVLIEGPKWCGKTTTAEQQANSTISMQDPDMRDKYQATIRVKPSLLLAGDTPRLIDEWQEAPVLWDSIRAMVDKRNEFGQFIMTGSNSIDPNKKSEFIKHSGSGRIAKMQMLTMSLYESLESNGKISLKELFDDKDLDIDGITSEMSIEELIFAACRGGWPASLYAKFDKAKLQIAKNYIKTVCSTDVSTIDGVNRNEKVASTILQSYARNISTRLVQEHNMTEKQIKLREPDLLMVITGGEMAYTRPDGVKIIPLACLKD